MEFKGTKGKWVDCNIQLKDWSSSCVGLSKGKSICHMYYEGILLTEEVKANALLISKAPEMLEMLQKVVLMTETCNGTFEDFRESYNIEIKKLIKEATEL